MSALPADTLEETVARRLRSHRARLTSSRARLVMVLAASGRPLTIPEILGRRHGLAQSSVYRNLVVLEQAGVVRRIVTHDERTRYELAEELTGHHHHLVCSRCGLVEDVPASDDLERSVAAAAARTARSTGFRIDHHRIDLLGICGPCS
ncbi:MAG: transcriptional repressor [Acidimicrobiia bacterium]|nr:transcriptional repressor [Acidimicrobiia bacterium]